MMICILKIIPHPEKKLKGFFRKKKKGKVDNYEIYVVSFKKPSIKCVPFMPAPLRSLWTVPEFQKSLPIRNKFLLPIF